MASRVAAGLRALFEKAPLQNGTFRSPAFLRHCAMSKMPLTGPAMVGLAHLAFQEVKAAFRERMRDRAGRRGMGTHGGRLPLRAPEFSVPRSSMNSPIHRPICNLRPNPSKRSSAVSIAGFWRSFIRPLRCYIMGFTGVAQIRKRLGEALAQTTRGCPSFHFGFFAADFTAATAVRMLDAIPERTSFVAPQRGDPRWRDHSAG